MCRVGCALWAALLAAPALAACQESTQIKLELTTTLACDQITGTSIATGAVGTLEASSPVGVTTRCDSATGRIGSLVIVPSHERNAEISIRVVAAVAKTLEACGQDGDMALPGEAGGCIVARRRVRFVPHVSLELPIALEPACLNVHCNADDTCQRGRCVSALIPDPESCATPNGCTPVGAGGAGGTGGGSGTTGSDAGMGGDDAASAGAASTSSSPVAAMALGSMHTCALGDNGVVKCWGRNFRGQLGVGDNEVRLSASGLPPIALGNGRLASAISAGLEHTCALLDKGSVKCWGQNDQGQLGLGDTEERGDDANEMGDDLEEVDLGTDRFATAIAAGVSHTCALLDGGDVKCWGSNTSGQLGLGSADQGRGTGPDQMGDNLPAVELGRDAVAILASWGHTCAVLDDGGLKCWGENRFGDLGLGDTDPAPVPRAEPIDLGVGRSVLAIRAGSSFTCALLDDASTKCWGADGNGVLGQGDPYPRGALPGEMGDALLPVDLGEGRSAQTLAAGRSHACGVLDDGSIKCWGAAVAGALGSGDLVHRGAAPEDMGDGLATLNLGIEGTVSTLAAGGAHTCAVFERVVAKCWGANEQGQLGIGDNLDRGDEQDEMGENLPILELEL